MSIASYKQSLWETAIIESYKGISIADVITKKPSRVDATKAVFNTASLTNGLQDYTGTVTFEGANTAAIDLIFNKAKYFAFSVDDIDKAQAAGDVMLPLTADMAYKIKSAIDSAVLTEAVAGAKAGNVIGTVAAKEAITTPSQAYDFIVDLGTKLDDNDVPEVGRFVIAKAEFVNLLAKDVRVMDNAQVLATGIVQGMEVNGMQVIKSNNTPANTVVALHSSAVGYGKQIDKLEALRIENSFADGLKGLVNFGVKTLQPEGIAVLNYSITEA